MLLIIVACFATSCTTTRISKANDARSRFDYPIFVESSIAFEKAWTKLVDVIAIKGYTISHLDKENGLFIGRITNAPYALENTSGQNSDSSAFLVLPRLRYQEMRGKNVESSKLVFPDSVSFTFNVRIRPNGSNGSFINVNIPDIVVSGGHYNRKHFAIGISSDTTVIFMPVPVKKSDWSTVKSTGKLEKSIIEAIKGGQTGKYADFKVSSF
jgi:hypothetical protein